MGSVMKTLLALSSLSVVLFGFGALLIPADSQIPIHWGLDFQPDNWASKWTALSFGPIISLLIPLLYRVLPAIEPRRKHLADASSVLAITLIAVQLLILVLYAAMVAIALGYPVNMASLAPAGIGLLFIVIGNYLGKVQSNFVLGIRTPWTLSSDNVWTQTHLVGGKVFMAMGALLLLTAWVQSRILGYAVLVLVPLMLLGVVAYSWWLWRREQDAKQQQE